MKTKVSFMNFRLNEHETMGMFFGSTAENQGLLAEGAVPGRCFCFGVRPFEAARRVLNGGAWQNDTDKPLMFKPAMQHPKVRMLRRRMVQHSQNDAHTLTDTESNLLSEYGKNDVAAVDVLELDAKQNDLLDSNSASPNNLLTNDEVSLSKI